MQREAKLIFPFMCDAEEGFGAVQGSILCVAFAAHVPGVRVRAGRISNWVIAWRIPISAVPVEARDCTANLALMVPVSLIPAHLSVHEVRRAPGTAGRCVGTCWALLGRCMAVLWAEIACPLLGAGRGGVELIVVAAAGRAMVLCRAVLVLGVVEVLSAPEVLVDPAVGLAWRGSAGLSAGSALLNLLVEALPGIVVSGVALLIRGNLVWLARRSRLTLHGLACGRDMRGLAGRITLAGRRGESARHHVGALPGKACNFNLA